jgi:Kef-type K+ transport system membrane component KefB
LTAFGSISVLAFAAVLTLAAIAGKQVCGLGVLHKGLDRLTIGIGMIPRGEVGLIFAANGLALTLAGRRVISDATYAAIVAMVVVTTMLAPPALKWSLARRERKVARATGSQAPPPDRNSLD